MLEKAETEFPPTNYYKKLLCKGFISLADFYRKDSKFELELFALWKSRKYSSQRKKIFAKISSFVKKGGVMIITFYSPIGGLATFLRRLLGYRLISHLKTMKEKTNVLKKAFSSHLKTMKSMSRSYEHWIQDSILNPHIYVGISTPRIFTKILKNDFKIYQSVPRFAQDWRWYKSLHGKKREFNENFLIDYDKISHCMIDFRMNGIGRSAKKNFKMPSRQPSAPKTTLSKTILSFQ